MHYCRGENRDLEDITCLLVNAPFHYLTEPYPPLGIAYMAAVLEAAGAAVRIVDLQVEKKDISTVIEEFSPNIVGITCVTSTYPDAVKIAHKIREVYPGLLLMGGPHVTFQDVQALEEAPIDVVVRGEGEQTMVELAEFVKGERKLDTISGITFMQNTVVQTGQREVVNLDDLPFPARHLLPMSEYGKTSRETHVLASRGCSYQCIFCTCTAMWKGKVRHRSPQHVLKEVDQVLSQYTFNRINFFDDTFTLSAPLVRELSKGLKKRNVEWSCETRIDRVTQDLIKKMADAGCFRIFFGAESGNQQHLNTLRKGTKVEQIRNVLKWCQKEGIIAVPSFMIGLPSDTEESINRTIEFALGLPSEVVWFFCLTPFPGTDLFEKAADYGITVKVHDFSKYTMRTPVAHPRNVDFETLQSLYVKAITSRMKRTLRKQGREDIYFGGTPKLKESKR